MKVKLLTKYRLEFINLKGGCRGSSETTQVKILHCWQSHATAHIIKLNILKSDFINALCNTFL